jgi:hypothetical protein
MSYPVPATSVSVKAELVLPDRKKVKAKLAGPSSETEAGETVKVMTGGVGDPGGGDWVP